MRHRQAGPAGSKAFTSLFSFLQPSILLIKGSLGEVTGLEHCHRARKGGAGVESSGLKHEAIYKL